MKITGIIIGKQNTNEYDQLISFYSPDIGKGTGIAKSILKHSSIQAMHLDLYNHSEFELVEGKGWPIITGAQAIDARPCIKSNLGALAVASFFAEAINKIVFDNEKDLLLWNFISGVFNELEDITPLAGTLEMRGFLRAKQMEFLHILGYSPNFDECGFCGRSISAAAMAYNLEINGAVCKDCFLSGRRGIIMKEQDFLSGQVLDAIFSSLVNGQVYASKFTSSVLK